MKASIWNNAGGYSQSFDIKFDSQSRSDCEQAEKYISAIIPLGREVTDDAEAGRSAPADGERTESP